MTYYFICMTYNEISVLTIISVTGDTLKQSDLTLHHSLGYDCTRLSLGQEDQWSDPSGWIIFKIKLLDHDARPSGGTTYTWWTAARFSMLLETSSTFSTLTPINWGRCHYTLLRIIYITPIENDPTCIFCAGSCLIQTQKKRQMHHHLFLATSAISSIIFNLSPVLGLYSTLLNITTNPRFVSIQIVYSGFWEQLVEWRRFRWHRILYFIVFITTTLTLNPRSTHPHLFWPFI